jgi:hypothetical protein
MSDHDHLREHPYSPYMEAMQAYTDWCIVEEFNKHGWPEGSTAGPKATRGSVWPVPSEVC